MGTSRDVIAPETEWEIVTSESGPSVDGYWMGEPCQFRCPHCGVFMWLTEQPTPGADALNHPDSCPNSE